MANVYSTLFASVHGIAVGTPAIGGLVPTGFIWVIRDIVAYNTTTFPAWVTPLRIYDTFDNVEIWATPYIAQSLRAYHVEMRQVVAAGHQLHASTTASNWDVRVSGYQLSTP